ncbi:uncharacterized protein VTP21DRAFT_8575 [Calcarisporiella thermophila]|uniref:uncharacterized protein n=1 Tax=Calcarisporiella thermophila TaxID=911321 RepID=UPI003742CE8D
MGLKYKTYLNGSKHVHVYGCNSCRTHLATSDKIISKNFHGVHGQAYLFHVVVNVTEGPPVDRNMTTGRHTVCDIYCLQCHCVVGWRYVRAFEESQRYKEEKYILERELLVEIKE